MRQTKRQDAKDALSAYRKMRRFDETPEPLGGTPSHGGNLFVVQKHDATRLHYDFRLELDGVLKSWAVTRGPSLDPGDKRLAVRTEDHPIDYADFEGIIPAKNYGAGTVLLWDMGEWTPLENPQQGLKRGKLAFELKGKRMKGKWALVRMNTEGKRENWLLIKEKDKFASDKRKLTEAFTTSVTSRRNLEQIEKNPDSRQWHSKPKDGKTAAKKVRSVEQRMAEKTNKKLSVPPKFHAPELATLVEAVPTEKEWIFEIKYDGYRAMLSASGERVHWYTRTGLDWAPRFRELVEAAGKLQLDGALLDGEIVVLDKDGRSSFGALQKRLSGDIAAKDASLSYFAFDLLELGGTDMRKLPLLERKEKLKALLGRSGRKGPIFYSDHIQGHGEAMLEKLCATGFEGIIAKRGDAPYRSGRGRDWLKIKCNRDQEFVIGGYSLSTKGRSFSSLLLGSYESGRLRYVGKSGTGYDEADFKELMKHFKALKIDKSPFAEGMPRAVASNAVWVKPELVAQIGFAEFTGDGLLRQARYLGLRADKKAKTVMLEKPKAVADVDPLRKSSANTAKAPAAKTKRGQHSASSGEDIIQGITLTHPDKILYPDQGITKRDLVTYLDLAWPLIEPHAKNRLMTLVRCPEGSAKKCFYQRHIGAGLDLFEKKRLESGSDHEDYIYLRSEKALIAAAQMGVLEFHIWGSRADKPDLADRLVFDFDPSPELDFNHVKTAAMSMRAALEALEIESFAMLSGGKGVHVVAPIKRRHAWPKIKSFTRNLALKFAENEPENFTANMSKAKRKGRIFIDYLRNDRASTAIMPYSPRAREGAPIAWPVEWDELQKASAANQVKLEDARKRIADGKTAWKNYGKAANQSLTPAAMRAAEAES